MKYRILTALAGAVVLAASSAGAVNSYMFGFTPSGSQTLTLNGGAYVIQASAQGWIDQFGSGNGASGNYIVGNCTVGGCGDSVDGEYRDYFVFDLSGVAGPITSASLSLGNPINGFGGDPATYTNWDVSTSLSELETGSLAAYADLGSGVQYSSIAVGAFDNDSQVSITLDSAALTALDASEGGSFTIGGALNGGAVPEPQAWTLMLAGFAGLGFIARRRREIAAA